MTFRLFALKRWLSFGIFAIISLNFSGLACLFADTLGEQKKQVYVIPIKGQISEPQLYILRRGLKQAIEHKANDLVLCIDTPGGSLSTTFEMMEALQNFKGRTYAFIDKEAISAGAYIGGATDLIYFHPQGLMGAAAVIQVTGENVQETLKKKIDSYLRARIRNLAKGHRYREDVIRAMMDEDFEFKIGDEIIKEKGNLLTLTAKEATQKYGNPPEALIGEGIVDSVEELLNKELGESNYSIISLKLTWSEEVAKWLNQIRAFLLGIGLLLLFIEFKTGGGFGYLGVGGVVFLLLVFASSYVAGLAGYETILIFILGVVLIGLEFFLFPGTLIPGILGIILILGSLVWAIADTWPNQEFEFKGEVFLPALRDVLGAFAVAFICALFIGKYFLKGWFWSKLVLKQSVPQNYGLSTIAGMPKTGDTAFTVTGLYPSGEIEVDHHRYQARAIIGMIESGVKVEIVGKDGFAFIVKKQEK